MARKEGMLSLGGGMSASMLREVVYSGLRLGTYELFKDKSVPTSLDIHSNSNTDETHLDCTMRVRARCPRKACL